MKQKKFGKRIQNWHRPIGRSELSQRFLRTRYDSPWEVEDCDNAEWDNEEPIRPYDYCPCCVGLGDPDDLLLYQLNELLRMAMNIRQPLISSGSVIYCLPGAAVHDAMYRSSRSPAPLTSTIRI